jgi:hypothetical protein
VSGRSRGKGTQMKRVLTIGAILATFAGGIATTALTGPAATASDGPSITQFRHLQRQVNRLDGQVSRLQGDVSGLKADVRDLLYDVFVCQFPGDPLTTFTDGSLAYVLYYDYNCTATFGPSQPDKPGLDRIARDR